MRWGGEVGLALGPARAAHFVSEEARKGQCLTRQVLLTHRSEMRLDGESAISLSRARCGRLWLWNGGVNRDDR